MKLKRVAVIDIGKTNAKLALVELTDLTEIAVVTRPNPVLPGPPWPHFDTEGTWKFLLDNLGQFHAQHGVDAISLTTHGACAALLDKDLALAAPILDYEHPGPDDLAQAYDALRPDFAETGAPKLAGGLNIGAQLFWQFEIDPGLRDRVAHIVTYPQYWSGRLTGVLATDPTSLGCHTDLWNPHKRQFSTLVDRLGIQNKLAQPRAPNHILGPILPEIAAQTGLAPNTPVFCGIHDSNASLLPHVMTRDLPFSVVSSGTWMIAMSMGGQPIMLDPDRDTLINVNALGAPVPSARFMGGREYDILSAGNAAPALQADIAWVLAQDIMVMPAIMPDTGPFQGCAARWIGTEPPVGSGHRAAGIAFYLALMTASCLKMIGHRGQILVEGPFARNQAYLQMLAAATMSQVIASQTATGTSQGAAMLAVMDSDQTPSLPAPTPPVDIDQNLYTQMQRYAMAWEDRRKAHCAQS